jgi:murein DD-endopeptidase
MRRIPWMVGTLGLAAALLAGCASHELLGDGDPQTRHAIVLEALGQIGRPYRFGGTDNDGFDCSGLVQYIFAQSGIQLPRSARQQHEIGQPIDFDEAVPGDLLFYNVGGKVDHVVLYLGEGRGLHAPGTGRKIIVASVERPYWRERFVDAVRVLR